ncbi:hypothetical protein ACSBR2_038177 [Camellia fascicularis]
MANDGQKEKIGDDIPSGSGKHADLNMDRENCQGEYYNESDFQVWKDRCLRRDGEMKGMTNKLADLQSVVNFMMQNNVMQPSFPLEDTPIPAAKNDAQKGEQKAVPAVPQHERTKEHSHRPSREVRRGESMRGESQKTSRAKGTYVKEYQHAQGKELCFDTMNEGRSKRTHNDTGSSAPKRLKSVDSRAPGRTKEDLRDYL